MTRDGDGDYWRREDARRAQLDRAFWRDYEQRRSREREVREYEARRRGLGSADGSLRAPAATAVDVGQADHDDDIAVGVDAGERNERGWIRRRLIALRTFVTASGRTGDMIAALVERGGLFGYRRSMPWTDLPSPLDSGLGGMSRAAMAAHHRETRCPSGPGADPGYREATTRRVRT